MAALLQLHAEQERRLRDHGFDLRAEVRLLLEARDVSQTSLGELRRDLALHLSTPSAYFDKRSKEIEGIIADAIAERSDRRGSAHTQLEEFGQEEKRALRCVYLVTLPHPRLACAADGTVLRPPGALSRQQVIEALLKAAVSTQGQKAEPVQILRMTAFRERHEDGEVHYHVAVEAKKQFRFQPFKAYLVACHGLASHWSTTHDHYGDAVAYGYIPSPKKPIAELDPAPLSWSADGHHAPLADASRPPVNASMIAARREAARRSRAEKGRAECFEDIDMWPIVVRENFVAEGAGRERLMAYAKRCGGPAMIKFCFTHWPKLDELITRVWQMETVEEYIEDVSKTRDVLLQEAADGPCVCGGKWRRAACELFHANGINLDEWRLANLKQIRGGRTKGSLICHVGREGNEGKSFLLQPLMKVFGEEFVFVTPPPSNFPLLGLERSRVVLLDDWRFNENILSYNLQLLWFEGKPIVISRPQNAYAGHLRYSKDAPVWITTLEADLMSLKKNIKEGDVAMMLKRLHVFRFQAPLAHPDENIVPCPHCFANLLLCPHGRPATSALATAPAASAHPGLHARMPESAATAPPAAKRPRSWSVAEVVGYLESLGLGHMKQAFLDNGVDGDVLASLSEEELQSELGLTKIQARKVRARLLV